MPPVVNASTLYTGLVAEMYDAFVSYRHRPPARRPGGTRIP